MNRGEALAPDAVVIGAGIGGLTAAALLARRGFRVIAFDQHTLAGGYCTSWERHVNVKGQRLRFVFDAGVHDVSGLGEGGPVRGLLEDLGIASSISWRRVHHEHASPGLRFRIPETVDALVDLLARQFPEEAGGIADFFREMELAYRALTSDGLGGRPWRGEGQDAEQRRALLRRNRQGLRWLRVPFQSMLRTFVRVPELRAALSRLGRYRTDDLPALSVGEMVPLYGYLFDGGFYPVGGSQVLADALAASIRRDGGEVRLGQAVRRILVEGGRAAGVVLDGGEEVRAAAVISNADVKRTVADLVPADALPSEYRRRIEGAEPSTSAFEIFLGVSAIPDLAEAVFYRPETGPGISVWTPSMADPSLAPAGHSAVTLIVLVPNEEARTWDRARPEYAARKRELGDGLLASAERLWPGLRARVVFREDATPATFRRYAWTADGAIYGLASTALRPPARTPLPGLYLAGSGTFPGPGVEGVVVSGGLAAQAVTRELEAR